MAALDDVLDSMDLPAFLGAPLAGLAQALAGGRGAGAAWFLKDAVEVFIKTCHAALVARALEQADDPALDDAARTTLRQLARRLLESKPGAGTLVHELREVIKRPALLGPDGGLAQRLAAALTAKPKRGQTTLVVMQELTDWRNNYSGHGAQGDDARALAEATERLPQLLRLLEAVRPLLGELLVTQAPSAWADVRLRPLLERLAVRHAGKVRPERPQVLEWIERAGPHDEAGRQRVHFRDAESGDVGHRKRSDVAWPELGRVEALADSATVGEVPVAAQRGRDGAFAAGWLLHLDTLRFAGFTAGRYLKPRYLVARVERALECAPSGWLRVLGPGGVGKSFLCRGLCEQWRGSEAKPAIVLPLFLLPGDGQSGVAFRYGLEGALSEEIVRLRSRGVLCSRPAEALQESRPGLGEWLRVLAEANPRLERIVLVLDGVDELEPADATSALTALLPPELPQGVFGVVSGRAVSELDPTVARDLAALPWLEELSIEPASEENCALLRAWLRETTLDAAAADVLLERAGNRFLYVDHFARWAHRLGVLPTSEAFYSAVLAWLRGRVAVTPLRYREALDRTLRLLACAREPVPLEVLVAAGVAPDHVTEVLIDLHDLLAREVAGPDALRGLTEPYVYRIFHRELLNHLRHAPDEAAGLRAAETEWAQVLLEHAEGTWEAADPDDPVDAYAVSHLSAHLAASSVEAASEGLAIARDGFEALAARARTLVDERRFVAARRWVRGALGLVHWTGPRGEDQHWLIELGDLAMQLVDREAAEAAFREALPILQQAGDGLREMYAWTCLGEIAEARCDLAAADAAFREAVTLGLGCGPGLVAASWSRLGAVAFARGDLDAADAAFRQTLVYYRRALEAGETDALLRLGDTWSCLGSVAQARGDMAGSDAAYRQALGLSQGALEASETPAALRAVGNALDSVGGLAQRSGDLEAAEAAFRQALALHQRGLEAGETPDALLALGTTWNSVGGLAQDRGDLDAAEAAFRQALTHHQRAVEAGDTPDALCALGTTWDGLGKLAQARREFAAAKAAFQRALDFRQRRVEADETQEALLTLVLSWIHLGELGRASGDLTAAEAAFAQALASSKLALELGETADALCALGVVWRHVGRLAKVRCDPAAAEAAFREYLAISRRALEAGETPDALRDVADAWSCLRSVAE